LKKSRESKILNPVNNLGLLWVHKQVIIPREGGNPNISMPTEAYTNESGGELDID